MRRLNRAAEDYLTTTMRQSVPKHWSESNIKVDVKHVRI